MKLIFAIKESKFKFFSYQRLRFVHSYLIIRQMFWLYVFIVIMSQFEAFYLKHKIIVCLWSSTLSFIPPFAINQNSFEAIQLDEIVRDRVENVYNEWKCKCFLIQKFWMLKTEFKSRKNRKNVKEASKFVFRLPFITMFCFKIATNYFVYLWSNWKMQMFCYWNVCF